MITSSRVQSLEYEIQLLGVLATHCRSIAQNYAISYFRDLDHLAVE